MQSGYYKRTGTRGVINPRDFCNDNQYYIARLTLSSIPRNGGIFRRDLQDKVHSKDEYGNSDRHLSFLLARSIQYFIEKDVIEDTDVSTISEVVSGGLLNYTEFQNYRHWAIKVGIIKGHNERRGSYSPKEIALFTRIGRYKPRFGGVKAFKRAVRETYGSRKEKQFDKGYEENSKRWIQKDSESRRINGIGSRDWQSDFILRPATLDIMVLSYDDEDYRSYTEKSFSAREKRGKDLSVMHDRLLEKLLGNFLGNNKELFGGYPLNLYALLADVQYRFQYISIVENGLDVQMRSMPAIDASKPIGIYRLYEAAIFIGMLEELDIKSIRIRKFLDEGLYGCNQEIDRLANILKQGDLQIISQTDNSSYHLKSRIRNLKRSLRLINRRYNGRKSKIPFRELEKELPGVETWQGVKIVEKNGIDLLLDQIPIKELLTYDFWEIPELEKVD